MRLVLAGGGHAHVAVLRRLGLKPVPGLDVTLVDPDPRMAYSGMLPGWIAGHYHARDVHIDLPRLARFAGARWVNGAAANLDADAHRITLADGTSLAYDLLSLNTGAAPAPIEPAGDHVVPVKPVARLMQTLDALECDAARLTRPLDIAIVGGGAGGVELALALAHRFRGWRPAPRLALFTRSTTLLPDHPAPVRRRLTNALAERAVAVHIAHDMVAFPAGGLVSADGARYPADTVFRATGAQAPGWLRETGLALDTAGFVRVNAALQSISHASVFAAGDICALPQPRPKSGVFAVREGAVLGDNLVRQVRGQPLRAFSAQRNALALITTGDRYAIASRGHAIAPAGRWLWYIKDWIDRRFVARYNDLPTGDDRA